MTNRYLELADELRREIEAMTSAGDWQLATEAELRSRFGVSRATVRAGLEHLRGQGMVTSRRGSGWYATARERWEPLLIRVTGPRTGARSTPLDPVAVSSRRRRPDRRAAAILGTKGRIALLVVERASAIRGEVVHTAVTWFAPDASAMLANEEAEATPPARLVASRGFSIASVEQYAEAIAADAPDAERFNVATGSPLLQVVRIARSKAGSAIFFSRHRHPGDRVQIQIELPTTDQPQRGAVGLIRIDGA